MKFYCQLFCSRNVFRILSILFIILSHKSKDVYAHESYDSQMFRETEEQSNEEILSDPFEAINRGTFQLNQGIDDYIVHPVSQGYTALLPQFMRKSIHQFLINLRSPIIFLNDVLQGEGDQAMETLGRFVINSTLGLAGFFDPAAHHFNLSFHDNEFGLTLGSYGIQSGFYLVLPVVGPSNPRDTLGLIVNFLLDPFYLIAAHNDVTYLSFVRTGVEIVDKRIDSNQILQDIKQASDPYLMMKTLYEQNREFNVKKGKIDYESATPID